MSCDCTELNCTQISVEPECAEITIMRGTDNQLEVTITDGDGKAVAINADTIEFTVKTEPGGSVVFSKNNGPGGHSDPGLGQTIFNIAAADTVSASETDTTYWAHEIRRITGAGEQRVHMIGNFIVRPTI